MKLAAGDFAVWLIIAIIMVVGKLWNKFVSMQADEDEPAPAPPPVHRARPAQQPMPTQREVNHKPRTQEVRPVPEQTRQVQPKDLRDLMERLTRPPQPKPVAPPPASKAAEPASKPAPARAKPAPEPSRTSRWAEALRDRQNLRNIIISAEIIGPPRGA